MHGVKALLAALLLAGCGTTPPVVRDPGDLEVWNTLREELLVVVSGRGFTAAACEITRFEDVELRGVILASRGGVAIAAFAADSKPTPIGPRRYLLIGTASGFADGTPAVFDLRTRPSTAEPDGRTCRATVEDVLNRNPVGPEAPFDELEQVDVG